MKRPRRRQEPTTEPNATRGDDPHATLRESYFTNPTTRRSARRFPPPFIREHRAQEEEPMQTRKKRTVTPAVCKAAMAQLAVTEKHADSENSSAAVSAQERRRRD